MHPQSSVRALTRSEGLGEHRRRALAVLATFVLAAAWALAGAPAPAHGAELATTVTVNATTSAVGVYDIPADEAPPTGAAYPYTSLTGVVEGCPGGFYSRQMSLTQDGHAALWATSGLGANDWFCDGTTQIMEMGFYNPDFPIHPGTATATIELYAETGELVATDTRTVTIPTSAVTAPTGVSAASTSASSATLTWDAPVSDGGSPVTGYWVGRDGGNGWSTVVGASARSWRFNRLGAGNTYHLSVYAITDLGSSPVARVTVVAGTPGLPTAVTATSVSDTRATLAWSAPATSGASAVTGYRVTRTGGLSTQAPGWSTTVPASARSWTFNRLSGGDYYTFSVAAINAQGTGTPVSVTTLVGSWTGTAKAAR